MGNQKKDPAAAAAPAEDEMADILDEIKELQQQINGGDADEPVDLKLLSPFKEGADDVPEPDHSDLEVDAQGADADMSEFQGSSGDSSMEEMLSGLEEEEPSGKSLLDVEPSEPVTPIPIRSKKPQSREDSMTATAHARNDDTQSDHQDQAAGSLSMQLTGNMQLALRYEVDGVEVRIGFTDGALRVELADGTEFKIPLKR